MNKGIETSIFDLFEIGLDPHTSLRGILGTQYSGPWRQVIDFANPGKAVCNFTN